MFKIADLGMVQTSFTVQRSDAKPQSRKKHAIVGFNGQTEMAASEPCTTAKGTLSP